MEYCEAAKIGDPKERDYHTCCICNRATLLSKGEFITSESDGNVVFICDECLDNDGR